MQQVKRISTFVINLKKRIDRKEHILKEFAGRNEFLINIVEPFPHEIGAVSLWNTIRHIVQGALNHRDDFVLICEDDHHFTRSYSKEHLFNCIAQAIEKRADVLSGGVHWFNSGLQVSDHLFWVDKFTGAQFIIVFRHFFNTILEANFSNYDAADLKISELTNRIFFIGPFISVQKDFGYSDATPKNNVEGKMEQLFAKASASVQTLKDAMVFYKQRVIEQSVEESFENISIPTYIINPSGRSEDYKHIEKEFIKRSEFDTTFIEVCEHEIAPVGLWLSIRKIIGIAIANDDDVIIICENSHEFTEHYSKGFLIQNIIEAHEQGVEIIFGSVRSFGLAVPITKSRAWLNHFYRARFIILYRSVFQKILDEPFDDNVKIDAILSDITSNKMMLFPFISMQDSSEHIDFMALHDENNELIASWLEGADAKLQRIYEAANIYNTSSLV
jgi:hypothetical protein